MPKVVAIWIFAAAGTLPAQSLVQLSNDVIGLHPVRSFGVRDVVLRRDVGEFVLSSGTITVCSPLRGETVAVLFSGHGSFSAVPPVDIERAQLVRTYGEPGIRKRFTSLFILFGDSTLNELESSTHETIAQIDNASTLVEKYVTFILDYEKRYMTSYEPFFERLVNHDEFFFAAFSERSNVLEYGTLRGMDDPLFFRMDNGLDEEIEILRRGTGLRYWLEAVSAFQKGAGSAQPTYLVTKDAIRLSRYQINAELNDAATLSAHARITGVFLKANLSCIAFKLFHKIRVDSVRVNGISVDYLKPFEDSKLWDDAWDRDVLWIALPSEAHVLSEFEIDVYYRGEVFERVEDDFYLRASGTWYPRFHGVEKEKAMYDLRFTYPSAFKLASIGVRTEEAVGKRTTTSRWVTERPARNASFGFGFLDVYHAKHSKVPPISVYIDQKESSGLFLGKGYKEQVADELANIIGFYGDLFGPLDSKGFSAVEIPYGHGEAFPGLIHLPWWTMRNPSESGILELFRAHEVAHQWWGIGVDYSTYHDKWISEAFAEYSGLWYVQFILNDNKRFFKFLDDYRERILKNRRGLLDKIAGTDQEAGPIWLGYRNSTRTTRGDYGLIVYEKGAWVLHMLRNLMLDLGSMKEDRFRALMRDFYQSYSGKAASTMDFQWLAEKHIGSDMSWFFKQWVYGVEVPKYTVRYKFAPAYKNNDPTQLRYQVTYKISQSNVSAGFQMYVPVQIDFGNNQYSRLRLFINQKENTIVLPLLPLEPKRLEFNYLHSVLCEVEEAPWQ